MTKVETTIENVLELAKQSSEYKKALEILFPLAFENEKVFCEIGQILKRKNYPKNYYALFKWNGEVRLLNVTNNKFWNQERNIKVSALKDYNGSTITFAEFKQLIGAGGHISEFEIIK